MLHCHIATQTQSDARTPARRIRKGRRPQVTSTKVGRPSAVPPLWNPLWMGLADVQAYVAVWPCGSVAMTLYSYLAMWLGLFWILGTSPSGGRLCPIWLVIRYRSTEVEEVLPRYLNCLSASSLPIHWFSMKIVLKNRSIGSRRPT